MVRPKSLSLKTVFLPLTKTLRGGTEWPTATIHSKFFDTMYQQRSANKRERWQNGQRSHTECLDEAFFFMLEHSWAPHPSTPCTCFHQITQLLLTIKANKLSQEILNCLLREKLKRYRTHYPRDTEFKFLRKVYRFPH